MVYNAKNDTVRIGNTDMDYISFGTGEKNVILLPGLGDGLKTVKGMAVTFAMMYKIFAKDFKVYVFSRKNELPEGYSTKDMAEDMAEAMKKLGIVKASVVGVSQGGMIAQYMAINHAEMIDKLILAVTTAGKSDTADDTTNDTVKSVVSKWIELAKVDDYSTLFIDIAEKSYSENYLKKYRPLYPILTRIGKPEAYKRFLIQANACINHYTYDELSQINVPTLIIGGDSDKVVGSHSSEELAERISGSKLKLYKGLGHATYEEAKDFNNIILEFLNTGNTGEK